MSSTSPPPPEPADRLEPSASEAEAATGSASSPPPATPTGPPPQADRDAPPPAGASSYDAAPQGGLPGYPGGDDAMPAYPQGTEPPPPEVPQPQSVLTAVRLMWAGAALSIVGLVIGLLSLSSIKDNIRTQLENNHDFSQSKLDTAYNVAVISTVIVAILAAALWLWMAKTNGDGKKWARITATTLGAVNVLGFVLSVSQGQEVAAQLVLGAVNVLLAVAILWLLWRPESTEYYVAKSRRY